MRIVVNINDTVRVRLSDHGRRIHRRAHEDLRRESRGFIGEYVPPKEDAEGWSSWQMWSLMHEFGAHLYNGCTVPFETEIELVGRV